MSLNMFHCWLRVCSEYVGQAIIAKDLFSSNSQSIIFCRSRHNCVLIFARLLDGDQSAVKRCGAFMPPKAP
jgi:hypothetical protein